MSAQRGEGFVMQPGPADGPISFTTFVLGLASTTLIHLGEAPNPETGKVDRQLLLARQSLDLLDLLAVKTRGNLTAEEEQLFSNLLRDLRLRWVQASSDR